MQDATNSMNTMSAHDNEVKTIETIRIHDPNEYQTTTDARDGNANLKIRRSATTKTT